MKGNNKVYIVTCGEYSDYRISAVFSDRSLADAYKAKIKDPYAYPEIEEYEVDCNADGLRAGYDFFFVRMDRDGNAVEVYIESPENARPSGFDYGNNLYSYAAAKDEAHAVKIVNERRCQLIANGEWPGERESN